MLKRFGLSRGASIWAFAPWMLVVFADVGPRCGSRSARLPQLCDFAPPAPGLLVGETVIGAPGDESEARRLCIDASPGCAGIQRAEDGGTWEAVRKPDGEGPALVAAGSTGVHRQFFCR